MTTPYTKSTLTVPASPPPESWTEVRCPACKSLGYPDARFLFKLSGEPVAADTDIFVVCDKCKSLVIFNFKTHKFTISKQGRVYKHKARAAFE